MIRQLLNTYKVPLLLTLLLAVIHFSSKDFTNPYERPIAGDAQAYYAYLPALFIYQDLDYSFTKEMNEKYYPPNYGKSFVKEVEGGEKVNKTFPGVAILYAPFFFMAHAIALIFDLDADGYSNIYQFFFLFGFWVYFLFGLSFYQKVLKKLGFESKLINFSMILIVLATNVFFYTIYDQSVTHIHNFFLINLLLYCLFRFKESSRYGWIGMAVLLLALIGITRPTNAMVVGLIFFFFPGIEFYKSLFKLLKQPLSILKTFLIGLTVFSIPFLLWKAQTGHWVVYSYGEEGFNFSNPHWREFLFSYTKGWMTYTPIVLFILIPGLVLLFMKNKKRALIAIAFYVFGIFVFSSWWCWYYGAGMSQRVMIDHYILLGFLLILILEKIREGKLWLKGLTALLAVGFIGLNIAQAYQIRRGIIPMGSATEEQYWDNFLNFDKKAKIYPLDHWDLEEVQELNFSPEFLPEFSLKTAEDLEGHWTIHVSSHYHFASGNSCQLKNIRKGSKLIFSFDARSRTEAENTRLVVDLKSSENSQQKTFNITPFLKKDEWVRIEYMVEPTQLVDTVKYHFWNGGSEEKVEFRDMQIRHFFSDEYR